MKGKTNIVSPACILENSALHLHPIDGTMDILCRVSHPFFGYSSLVQGYSTLVSKGNVALWAGMEVSKFCAKWHFFGSQNCRCYSPLLAVEFSPSSSHHPRHDRQTSPKTTLYCQNAKLKHPHGLDWLVLLIHIARPPPRIHHAPGLHPISPCPDAASLQPGSILYNP